MNVNFGKTLFFALPAFLWVASPSCNLSLSPLKLRGDKERLEEKGEK